MNNPLKTEMSHRSCPTHCCPVHGCKYGDDDCPVVSGAAKPVYPNNNGCEDCAALAQEKSEIERLRAAHDHQHNMVGLMLREAERNGRQRDELLELLESAADMLRECGLRDKCFATIERIRRGA